MTRMLKPEYQELADEFESMYGDDSCHCSTCSMPPCSYCEGSGTHDGHPIALEENPDAWEHPLLAAVRAVVENN